MSTYKNHPYYTHQPFFIEVLKNTTGNILECGCGDGSTLMIKENIKNTNRQLVSLESNLEWLNKYINLQDSSHKLYHVDANNDDCVETGEKWVNFIKNNIVADFEVVFIDQSPWLSRKSVFEYFLDKAKIIIIHDFDYFPLYNIIGTVTSTEYCDKKFKISCDLSGVVKQYKLFHPPFKYFAGDSGPPTLICSNIMDTSEFNDLIEKIEENIYLYYV